MGMRMTKTILTIESKTTMEVVLEAMIRMEGPDLLMAEVQGLRHMETIMTQIRCLRDHKGNILSNLYINHK